MIIFEAPFPMTQNVLVIPNPFLLDSAQPQNLINLQRAMDGTPYTTVKRTDRQLYTFDFELSRIKAVEYLEFCRLYAKDTWRMTWDSLSVIGHIVINPITLTKTKSDLSCVNGFDRVQVNFQFDGVPQ